MVNDYVPDVGHAIWVSLDPSRGREQSGRRPFLVLSQRSYNAKTSLVVGVPITTKRKGYPFEVVISTSDSSITGVALVDQIRSLDWRARFADFGGASSTITLRNVRTLLATFLSLS